MTLYLPEIFIGALNAALISESNSALMKVVCTLFTKWKTIEYVLS